MPRVPPSVFRIVARPTLPSATFVLIAGGDISFGRGTGQRILQDGSYNPLRQLQPLLERADMAFVNLESVLTDRGGKRTAREGHNTSSARADILATGDRPDRRATLHDSVLSTRRPPWVPGG